MINYWSNNPDMLMEDYEKKRGEFSISSEDAFDEHIRRNNYFKHNYNIVTDPFWYGGEHKYNPLVIIPTKLKLKEALRLRI